MNIKQTIHYTLTALLIFSSSLWAEAPLGFAEQLFEQQEYYRAITEYKRFIYRNPESEQQSHAHLQIARSFFEGQRYPQSRKHASQLMDRFPTSNEAGLAQLIIAASHHAENKPGLAAMALDSYASSHDMKTQESQQAAIQASVYYLWADEANTTLEILEELSKSSSDPRIQLIRDSASEYADLPQKSSKLAGTLSALLPGAGQLYAGKKSDALISFILNGALLFATYEAFDNGEHVTGALLGLIESGWYGGNIYNAASSAHKVNQENREQFLKQLDIQCSPFWEAENLGVNIEALFKF